MDLSLPNPPPADRLQVDLVDQATERPDPARGVAVDVVERRAGIEAGSLAKTDAFGEQAADRHVPPYRGPQQVDGNRARDQRIGVEGLDTLGVVREESRLHVRVHEEVAAQLVHDLQAGARERHIEFDAEGRRGEHHAADARRVVVGPRGGQHRADALCHYGDVFYLNT